jgi:hypothetical protein
MFCAALRRDHATPFPYLFIRRLLHDVSALTANVGWTALEASNWAWKGFRLVPKLCYE